jgi:hypothetical protein
MMVDPGVVSFLVHPTGGVLAERRLWVPPPNR